jgi:hypothetical protein
MWILSFLPDWFLQLVIHGMVIIGLILTFGGNLLKMFPPLATYSVMAKQVGIVVLVIGIYFEGGLANESKWQSRVKELEAKVAVSEEKSKTANAEKQTQAEIQKMAAISDTLGSLGELLGKDTEAGKAAAVAQATINTYKGITEIIAAKSVLPEPAASIAKGVQIAAVLATGLKSVSTIKGVNTSVPPTKAAQGGLITGVGSGTLDNIPVMVSNGESIINANSTRMFSPLLSAINEMGGGKRFGVGGVAGVDTQTSSALSLSSSISGLLDKPIKTYVVSSEVSSTQALDRQIKNRSTI